MLYIVFTTGRCNLACWYCGGSFPKDKVPWSVRYPVEALKRFISGDPEPVIAFYGGEPLLNPKFIEEVMDEIPRARFVIQTNATLINSLKPDYWLRFDAALLSIDGREEVTDYYRGRGIYKTVVKSAETLRRLGFKGDLIARMTISELSDVYLDVTHLASLNLFDHIHWQLDVVWSSRWRDFGGWCRNSYIPGLERLVELWLDEAGRGRVLGIVPFISLLGYMIRGDEIERPPCGSGSSSLAISTDGTVLACPIAVDVNWARLGNIMRDSRLSLVGRVKIGEPCTHCSLLRYCGGRCLYAHIERLWGDEGFEKVCNLTRHLIKSLMEIRDRVLKLIDGGVIPEEEFEYPPFNNTTEIIP